MQEPDNFLKEEWEAVILAGVILLIVTCMGLSFFRATRQQNFRPDSPAGKRYQPLFDSDSFAFLNQNPDIQMPRNPFQFQIRIAPPEAKKTPFVEITAQGKAEEGQSALENTAIPTEVVKETTTPVVQQQVFRLMRKRLTYMYSQADNTGKTSAVVKISGSDGEAEMHTPGAGEQILGITVLSISAEQLRLLDASGKQVNVPFGEAKTVVVREKQ